MQTLERDAVEQARLARGCEPSRVRVLRVSGSDLQHGRRYRVNLESGRLEPVS